MPNSILSMVHPTNSIPEMMASGTKVMSKMSYQCRENMFIFHGFYLGR